MDPYRYLDLLELGLTELERDDDLDDELVGLLRGRLAVLRVGAPARTNS